MIVTEETLNATAGAATVRFTKDRSKVVMLDFPFEYDGKLIDRVTIRRLSTAEVSQYYRELAEGGAVPDLPLFDVPQAIIEVMDDDDSYALQEELRAFLPRRLQALVESAPVAASESSDS